jgi:hypothetical protein
LRNRRPPTARFASSITTSAPIIFIAATVAHSAAHAYEVSGRMFTIEQGTST